MLSLAACQRGPRAQSRQHKGGVRTSDEVPEGQREGASREHNLQADELVAARVQLDIDELLRVLNVFPCIAYRTGFKIADFDSDSSGVR